MTDEQIPLFRDRPGPANGRRRKLDPAHRGLGELYGLVPATEELDCLEQWNRERAEAEWAAFAKLFVTSLPKVSERHGQGDDSAFFAASSVSFVSSAAVDDGAEVVTWPSRAYADKSRCDPHALVDRAPDADAQDELLEHAMAIVAEHLDARPLPSPS